MRPKEIKTETDGAWDMASGLLALLDDVVALAKAAASLDDAATQTIKASAKAAGVVIDDAAITPRYVVGFAAERELPIIGRIARGSLKNKILFLLPAALLLSAFTPWAITPLLMIGGVFLCFEGYEKMRQMMAPHNAHANAADATSTPERSRKRQWPALSAPTLFSRLRSWRLAWPASRAHTF